MASTIKEIHLSVFDQSVIRLYEQILLIFPFEYISNVDSAIQALRIGLSSALCQLPFMTATLELLDDCPGILRASYSDPVRKDHGDSMLTTSMALAADMKYDYAVMKAANFPPAMLPSSAFCPLGLRNHPGLEHPYAEGLASVVRGFPLPAMCAQGTLIPGGLVLSIYIHHSIADGNATDRLLGEWSRGVSQLNQEVQQVETIERQAESVADTSVARLAVDAIAHEPLADAAAECPDITTQFSKPLVRRLRSSSYRLKAKVLSIPTARISALRRELQAHTTSRISTFVTIATLMWTHVTRARSEALTTGSHSNSKLNIVFDTRKRLANPLFKEATGNMSICAPVSSSIPAMLQATPDLVAIADSISSALGLVDESWIVQRIKCIAAIPDPRTFRYACTYANGPDLFITNWQHLYVNWVWNIPGTSSDGKASVMRKPSYKSEGGVRILPRRNDGERDFEILVCLEEGEMERLIEGLRDVVSRVVEG